jgi:DNA-binding transcriptional MocR family regulator
MWVHVPGVSVARLLDEALPAGVSFGLGSAFFTKPADQPFMRLNFAAIEEAEIERGIATLGRLVVGQLAGCDAAGPAGAEQNICATIQASSGG